MNQLYKLEKNDLLEPLNYGPVSRMDLIKYSGASGDYNPIHTIDQSAEEAGLPGIIAHGMWVMGSYLKIFYPYLDSHFIENYSIRFSNMVFINDIIYFTAKLTDIIDGHYIFELIALNQEEKQVLSGKIKLAPV